ncbi:MAG: tellurite resistance TerB family protein, partial [Bosea sp. (in: a-proteobacteria)]
AVLAAPAGTGFEPEIASNETAVLFIRAMIAAAASDGHIDAAERQAIIGGLTEAGFDAEANTWLENEMANPASVDELVEQTASPELAAQVYTAARIAINPDKQAEKDFLAGLAGSLGLDAELVANIDVAATSAKA